MIKYFLNLISSSFCNKTKIKIEIYRHCSDSKMTIEEYVPVVHPKFRSIDIDKYVAENFPGWIVFSHS